MFQSTPKQRAASRANAQKSTGPRTTAGKAVSRFNALKHGIYAVHQIMFDETPEDLAELSAEYHELYSPVDAHERSLVDMLVHNEWRLRRMRRVEAGLWEHASNLFIVKNLDTTTTCTSAEAFATDSGTFERLQRVANSCDRAYHRAHKELVARGHALRSSQPEAGPQPSEPAPTPQPAAEPQPAEPAPTPQSEESKPASTSSASVHTFPETPAPAPEPAPVTPHAAPETPQSPLSAASASSRLSVKEPS